MEPREASFFSVEVIGAGVEVNAGMKKGAVNFL
jgi:hypothetical protein